MRLPNFARPAVETLEGREMPASLIPGAIVSGVVSAVGEAVPMTFSGRIGDRIELMTTGTPTQPGFNAYTDVYAPSGTRVAGFFAGVNTSIELKETGTYTAKVHDDNNRETGQFTVGLEGINPISPNPIAITKGGITRSAVLAPTDKVQLTFGGQAGDRVELISTSTPTQAGFNVYMEVFAPSGTRVEGFFAGRNVVLDLRETGTYMIQARDDTYRETGLFSIALEGIKPISPNPVPIVKGGITSGEIADRTEKDQLVFAGKDGDRVELISTSTPTQAGFNVYMEVFGPSGTRVEGFFAGRNVVLDLRETGNYMIQARDDNYTETGRYTIGLEGLNPISPGARALAPNVTVGGSITAATQKDQFTVNVPAGKRLQVTLTSTATDPGFQAYANIYGRSGTRVGGQFPGTQTFTISEPGVQMISVSDSALGRRGNYTIRVQLV